MPRSVGMTGSKWFRCDRCGRHYPVKYRRTQNGLDLCTWLPCWDRPGGQSRAEDARVEFPHDRITETKHDA